MTLRGSQEAIHLVWDTVLSITIMVVAAMARVLIVAINTTTLLLTPIFSFVCRELVFARIASFSTTTTGHMEGKQICCHIGLIFEVLGVTRFALFAAPTCGGW